MATDTLHYESVSATLPPPKRGRVRRSQSMEAAGLLSLLLLDQEGGAIPDNVQRFDEPEGVTLPSRSPEMLFALCIWSALPPKRKESVKRMIRGMAYADPCDPQAVMLNNMLNKRG